MRCYTAGVHTTPEFPEMLRLIDERSSVFRGVVQSAPDLGVQVPTCPEWTLLDLARHLGGAHRRWAAVVTAGPAGAAPAQSSSEIGKAAPAEREALLEWLSASTDQLLAALREAGPDRGCWTWWGHTESPETTGAVGRHQVHEVAVHTYDAHVAVGAVLPVPAEIAVDGVEEFSLTCGTTTEAWPYEPALVDIHATEGPSWRVRLSAAGSSVSRLDALSTGAGSDAAAADVSVRGSASDLVLMFYGRIPPESMQFDGDVAVFTLLRGWDT